jgi:hypothetical protein
LTGIGGLKGLKPNDLKIVKEEEKPWRKRPAAGDEGRGFG